MKKLLIWGAGDQGLVTLECAFGIPLATIVHPTALISSSAKIGSGTTILANVIININTKVGIGCIVNNGAIIEHDCMVGNYVNICPKFAMAGHSSIGYKSYLGIGSTVIDDIRIGNRVTVGAGAVVVSNISDNIVAIGVPAKKMLVDK